VGDGMRWVGMKKHMAARKTVYNALRTVDLGYQDCGR
jgi:hypothetical protein